MTLFKKVRNALAYPSITVLSTDEAAVSSAWFLVRYYYLFMPLAAFMFFSSVSTPFMWPNFDPLWPLYWSKFFSIDTTVNIIRLTFLFTAIASAVWYRHRFVRIAVFIAIWQAHAFASSFTEINHQWYFWLYTSLIFIFLPNNEQEQDSRRKLLLAIWWAQAAIMLSYSFSGIWKIYMSIVQLSQGAIGGFSPYALPYQLADWLPKLQNEAIFGPFLIGHPHIAWPMYLFVMYMQFFAFWTMVRPSLQLFWGFELLVFHIATYLAMGISFIPVIPLILILFFNSPFCRNPSWKEVAVDLPIFGQIAEFYLARRIKSAK